MEIETMRLRLRPFREEDYADFRDYTNDPVLCRMLGNSLPQSEQEFRDYFRWAMDAPGVLAITLKEGEPVIGHVCFRGLHPPLVDRPELEGLKGVSLSFALHRDHQRRGYMREALTGLLDELLLRQELDFVNGGYFSFNAASGALHRALGFEPMFSHPVHRFDLNIETYETWMTRERWAALRGK